MPYSRERASKGGHSDIVKNPDVIKFLDDCDYMRQPDENEAKTIAKSYTPAPSSEFQPSMVLASDASPYSQPISGKFPSTQVGYVKVSMVLIDVQKFNALIQPSSRFVDPFKVAEMHRNADAFSFALPGSNIRYKKAKSVKDGFRLAVWEQLSDDRTRFSKDSTFTIRGTLLDLGGGSVGIKKCPSCDSSMSMGGNSDKFVFTVGNEVKTCPDCGERVYLTDSLRIHEQISDYGDCTSAITRFMNAIEHLLLATFVRMLVKHQPKSLSEMAFIVDGPLAVFGQPASISFSLMALYYKVESELARRGYQPPIIIGLQKDGQVMEHARSIEPYLEPNSYRVLDDEYRNRYISPVNNNNFGYETYFGQDFIFKTNNGRIFSVAIPYPFETRSATLSFAKEKANVANYGNKLTRAFDLIRHFQLDLYENSVIPIALAHRHASISLVPGGKVLDLVTRHGLGIN
ncbi:MAG: hypothetical protein FDX30_04145 [Chlorobium sp.]|nr:MAG: hypothetical protein FDX30_04145 [Chlorobium sp.]